MAEVLGVVWPDIRNVEWHSQSRERSSFEKLNSFVNFLFKNCGQPLATFVIDFL